eukprot:CAMPEP_0174954942 /NCGR_PEP_ID=MMETSP0004_2-20121128/710_1 /TAXON_ID=420556 /ORGANISM="Ochromonas sp., Strain CCMP1393" /LENGTH=218 /DNA_ID=CAMNT_0016202823 /DNA_START=41 /DNA_END=697 /DNA_ORIENTATION=+
MTLGLLHVPTRSFLASNGGVGSRTATSTTALFLSTSDFKNGLTFEYDGAPVKLLEFLHVKPGKGAAFVRSKIKNLITGSVQEKTFRAGESITPAEIVKTEMQYTYTDGENFCFMNMETFEEQVIEKKAVESPEFLIEGLSCNVLQWNDQVIDVALPAQMAYKVVETPPNFKGNTAQGAMKPATLECGAVVNVPMFIEVGENILVSTADKKYMNRASSD